MMHFLYPWACIFVLLPFFMPLTKPIKQITSCASLPFMGLVDAQSSGADQRPWYRRLSGWSTYLIWLIAVLMAMGPVDMRQPQQMTHAGADIALLVDISASMGLQDQNINGRVTSRLAVIKQVASHFIDQRRSDRLGLVVFGSQAFMQTPLTFDHRVVKDLLFDTSAGLAGKQTAMGDALAVAIKQLAAVPNRSDQVIILLTDGLNNIGQIGPQEAARMAKSLGIRVYTIGFGRSRFASLNRSIDPSALRRIAGMTGGRFFHAIDGKALAKVYATLNNLEPVDRHGLIYRHEVSLVIYLLGFFVLTILMHLWFFRHLSLWQAT